ncbi:nucleoplasmin-2 isoform X2 [Balaenoptera ricei]|nr:nucleoplasmin-2 isoform X2 [Balaenoptera ricei]
MNLSRTSSTSEKATLALLWGCELSQEKPTWTFRPQKVGKQDCTLLLSTICLGEKAKEEMNLVEILPPASQDDRKRKPITLASLRASVLPMVVLAGLELSPPVTFQLRAGSGPVFLCGQERYDQSWEEEEGEEEDLEEEEEEEEEEEDDDDEDIDVSLEKETPVKQVKRLAPQKHTSVAKVREGRPPTPQRLLRNLDQASPVECAEARGNTCQVPGGSLLCPWALPELPIMLVFGFQEKKVEKEEVAVR